MNSGLINQQVEHISFGSGVVTGWNEHVLTVSFMGAGEKKFIYPDAFEKYLSVSTPELGAIIQKDIDRLNNEKEAERQRQQELQEETKARIMEERARLSALKRKSTAKKTATKKAKSANA